VGFRRCPGIRAFKDVGAEYETQIMLIIQISRPERRAELRHEDTDCLVDVAELSIRRRQ
jgi:hypothetical protein